MVFAAVKGCKFSITPPVMAVEGVTTIQVITPESQNVKINGKGIYSGNIQVTVTNAMLGSLKQNEPATITISPDKVKYNKVDHKLCLGVGDKGQTVSPVTFSAGQTTSSQTIEITITDAGQDKIKVE